MPPESNLRDWDYNIILCLNMVIIFKKKVLKKIIKNKHYGKCEKLLNYIEKYIF